ncbi:PilW family protein [Conexibacter sp. SYSU D00693]|uniref:PilW family protein n=1 Tax=Conexibacter sp. SYSU D00693 TaxID=2812560 RepID=UPI00196B33A8|nr:hypothetical protein [Conexibacter sp. SYSU D00693]
MRAWLRGQRGEVGLVELLIGAAMMLGAVGAALTVFETALPVDAETRERNTSQDQARTALDRLARQLRNLASPTPDQPQAVDRATPFDVVFQSVDPVGPNAGTNAANVQRMRWCLDGGTPTARLYLQTQTWTTAVAPAVPSATACPGAGWSSTRVVATDVANRAADPDVPLFAVDGQSLLDVSALHAELVIDTDPGAGAPATRLATGVFLRNQNRRPVAQFTATPSAKGIVLNGSLSSDPEGQELRYRWFDGAQEIGTGVVLTHPVPTGSGHQIRLEVSDPAGLTTSSGVQELLG